MYRRYQTKKSEQQGCISCCDLIKIIGKVLPRILNLQGTEDDGDCLLGSGVEKIVFEKYDEERKDDLDRAQLIETPSLSNNTIMDYEEELSSIELSNIETDFAARRKRSYNNTILNTGDHLIIDSNDDEMLEKGIIPSSEVLYGDRNSIAHDVSLFH